MLIYDLHWQMVFVPENVIEKSRPRALGILNQEFQHSAFFCSQNSDSVTFRREIRLR